MATTDLVAPAPVLVSGDKGASSNGKPVRRLLALVYVPLSVVAVGIGLVSDSLLVAALVPAIAGVAWVLVPHESHLLPRRWVVLLTAFMFSTLLLPSIAALLQILVLVSAFAEWVFSGPRRRGTAVVFFLTILTVAYWALLILHPNVPDLTTGILGFRKTVLALGGLILGAALPVAQRLSAERFVAGLLTIALAVSIIGHLWVPAIPAMVNRGAADIYTSLYAGEARLEGIFSGPFHAATAGVLLAGWGLVRFKDGGLLAKVGLIIGLLASYLTLVRSAYVAIALCVLALIFMSNSVGTFVKRMLTVAALLVSAVAVAERLGLQVLEVAGSILDIGSDTRFLNRFPGYEHAFSMLGESPFIGWGAGSAGDTLGSNFPLGAHVTPHNLLLKVLVEGGLIGGLIWIGLFIAIWLHLDRRTTSGQMGVVALVGLLVFGLTGSAIEALPVTFFLFIFIGLGLQERRAPERVNGSKLPNHLVRYNKSVV